MAENRIYFERKHIVKACQLINLDMLIINEILSKLNNTTEELRKEGVYVDAEPKQNNGDVHYCNKCGEVY